MLVLQIYSDEPYLRRKAEADARETEETAGVNAGYDNKIAADATATTSAIQAATDQGIDLTNPVEFPTNPTSHSGGLTERVVSEVRNVLQNIFCRNKGCFILRAILGTTRNDSESSPNMCGDLQGK